MKRVIALKIDVTKIDKSRLFKGAKGTYLDAVAIVDDVAGQYGDNGMITQSVSKGERLAGTKGAILGNTKILAEYKDDSAPAQAAVQPAAPQDEPEGDIPF